MGGEIKRKGDERRGGEGRERWDGMGISDLGFLDGKGNGGIEVVGFGEWALFLLFSHHLFALSSAHTHSCPLILCEFTPPFLQAFTFLKSCKNSRINLLYQTRPNPFPGSITRSHRL